MFHKLIIMNKQFLIVALLFFANGILFGQAEFAPVGAEWYYQMHESFGPRFGYDHFTVIKDTQFLETDCRKVNVERIDIDGDKYDEFSFYLYDENGKVYISYKGNFELLYNFNLNTGDTLKSIVPFEYIFEDTSDIVYLNQEVDSVETIEISGFPVKRIYLNTIDNSYYFDYITEKIGGNAYFFPYDFVMADFLVPSFRCYNDSEIDITLLKCDSTNNSWLSIENKRDPDIIIKQLSNTGIEIYSEYNEFWNSVKGIIVLDIQGIILNYIPIKNTQNKYLINMENLPTGIYIITIITENKIINKKILWEN